MSAFSPEFGRLVSVPVVQVGIVRVAVPEWLVPVHVGVRFDHRPLMRVLVVGVMYMQVLMLDRFVQMGVLMPLAEMQPDPDRHQQARAD